MDKEFIKLRKQFAKLLELQDFHEDDLDYSVLDRHLELLNKLDRISSGAISVFDMYRGQHAYHSPKFAALFGWDLAALEKNDLDYGNKKIHPEDRVKLMQAGVYFTSFAMNIDHTRRRDFKVVSDYRMRGPRDNYIRVVEQQSVLELDKHGNIWLALSILDFSPDSDISQPFRCRMINHKTGDIYIWPPREPVDRDILSMREKEILNLISKGLVSREIADLLYISVNTVNTHRQRIIEKLDVSNTSEAVRYAIDLGILNDEQ